MLELDSLYIFFSIPALCLLTSVADPGPLDPGSGSGMNNLDHSSESLKTIFWVKMLKFFDADPGSGIEKIRMRD
jgi:hypothetical protein